MKERQIKISITAVFIIFMLPSLVIPQEFVQTETVREGTTVVDYFERKIVISGTGAAGEEKDSAAERRVWALNEARRNCYTLAAMKVGGVSVYGKTLLEAGRVKSENIEIHIRNYVRGISEISEHTERYPDGSYLATVTMTIMFDGNQGLNNLLYNYVFEDYRERADSIAVSTSDIPATGIVIDATGVDLIPSISPRIIDAGGREVYSPGSFSREYAMRIGIAGYTKDLLNVSDRIGDNPHGFRALSTVSGDPSSIIVSIEDADRILSLDRQFNLLGKCRVAFRVK